MNSSRSRNCAAGVNSPARRDRQKLEQYQKELGVGVILTGCQTGTLPHEQTRKSMELLAREVLPLGHNAIDDLVELVIEPGGREHITRVGARRHDRAAQPCLPRCMDVAHRTLIRLDPVLVTSQPTGGPAS